MTNFDCLNTELLLEIFDYLSFSDIFLAFFNLQQRINNAIQTYPLCIDLSKTSVRKAIKYGPFMCRTLIVSCNDSEDNDTDYLYLDFNAIRTIELRYVNISIVKEYLEQMPMEQIESIIIENLDLSDNSENTNQHVWSKIAIAGQNQLHYLRVSLRIIEQGAEQLLFDLPSLREAHLKDISAKEMLLFMSHTPNLRSFIGNINIWNNNSNDLSNFHLHKLNYLNLYIKRCNSFDSLKQILSRCSYVTHFELQFWITVNNQDMVNTKEWQNLIETCLPCLKTLRIRLFRYIRIPDENPFADTFELSEYWLRKKPQFNIQV